MAFYVNREVQTEQTVLLRRKLDLNESDILSTPPSELRKEIFKLRNEIFEAYEFHDLEFRILQEEYNTADSKTDITTTELQKSLKIAEGIILESEKEISNLKALNQELEEECKNKSTLKEKYEDQISELQLTLKKKICEIENLKKDQNDSEYSVELLRKNYERKIEELQLALEQYRENDCENEGGRSCNISQRKLSDENERTEELNEIRCTFEEQIKKLKDEHNNALKSLELSNANLQQTNRSLTEKLKEANEAVVELKQRLHNLEDTRELLREQAIITELDDSSGQRCDNKFEISLDRVANSCSISDGVKPETIKKDFEAYKYSESKDSFRLIHRTVQYLGALCSQIEDSGSSLNVSSSSFDSFDEGLPSSTVMEDFTEAEISAINEATICNDPLALTRDNTLQTPWKTPVVMNKNPSQGYFKTPFKCVPKTFGTPLNTPSGNIKKQLYLTTPHIIKSENTLNERETLPLKSNLVVKNKEIYEIKDMCEKKISHSEEILSNSLKRFSLLEERISRLENVSSDFRMEKEKLTAENCKIQERLNKNLEEISQIREKLVVEITSLNPRLDSLTNVSISSLLDIFLNAIMESCTKIPEELSEKLQTEIKVLKEKTEIDEDKLAELSEKIERLKTENATLLEEKDEIEKRVTIQFEDEIKTLRFENSDLYCLKRKVKDLEQRLEESDDLLKTANFLKENTLKDLQKLKTYYENDNSNLKLKVEQSEKVIEELRLNLVQARKEHLCTVMKKELELKRDEGQVSTWGCILEKYKQEEITTRTELEVLSSKLNESETVLSSKIKVIETLTVELEEANKSKVKCENIISELMENLEKENISLRSVESSLEEFKRNNILLSEDNECLNSRLKLAESDLAEKMEIIDKITTEVAEARDIKAEDEKLISKLKVQVNEYESVVERMSNVERALTEKVEDLNSELKVCSANLSDKTKIISRMMAEVSQAQNNKTQDERVISELRAEIEILHKENMRLEELNSTIEKYKEIEYSMSEKMKVLNSSLLVCEADLSEKTEIISRLSAEIEEVTKTRIKNEQDILHLRKQIEEMECLKAKTEALNLVIKNSKETEHVLSEKVEDLSSKLVISEANLMENLLLISELRLNLEKAENTNAESKEVILELSKNIKILENEKTKVKELELIVENLKETKDALSKKVEELSSSLKSTEKEKTELEHKILRETEEASKTKAENEEILAELSIRVRKFDDETAKLERFEATIKQLKEKEKIMSERVENLNSKLLEYEAILHEKTETLAQMDNKIEEAKLIKIRDDDTISALQLQLESLRKLQLLDIARSRSEQNEKAMLIDDLHNKLNELNTEIECLRKKLCEAEENLKLYEEKVIRLGEIESGLKTYKEIVDKLQIDYEKMKELENDFLKVTSELEDKNKELQDLNNDVLEKLVGYEKLNENNINEIKLLKENLYSLKEMLRLTEAESEKWQKQLAEEKENILRMEKTILKLNTEILELKITTSEKFTQCSNLEQEKEILQQNLKEAEERKDEMRVTILNIENKLGYPLSDASTGPKEWLSFVVEKIDKLLLSHNEEVKNLKQEVMVSKEVINNLQTEIDDFNGKVVKESNSVRFVKTKERFFEKMTPLKSTPVTGRSRLGMSPPHMSRRLEKLEDLNDLLNGTLQKVIAALNIPVSGDFFSVDCYQESENKIMKYISGMKLTKIDMPELNETRSEVDVTYGKDKEMCRIMTMLKACLSNVVQYLKLPEETVSSEEIISKIEKNIREIKEEFLERIAVLRQDNQHLDDDNNLLQTEMKKIVEQNNAYKMRIRDFEKSEELLKADVQVLKSELLKSGKNKMNKKNDSCSRKLDKLEELHQSLIDLLKKILALTEMENWSNLNLFTSRTFDMESRKIFDHFNNWMLKKSKEVQELKSKIEELDEECESSAKKIKEDSQQIYKAWDEVRNLKSEKGKLKEEIKSLKCDLEKLRTQNNLLHSTDVGTDWNKEMELLKTKNISLLSQITVLTEELEKSRKQREDLDEECESLAAAVKQEGMQRIKIWEEFQNELKTLNDRIARLEEEKKCLESEKGDLLKEIKAKENERKRNFSDLKDGLNCKSEKELKEVRELRSTIISRDMRILELEQINESNAVRKTQVKSLENSLYAVKKKLAEENEKNQKLQAEIEELSKKGLQEQEVLGKLRVRDYGIVAVNQIQEREKLQKLERDNKMLKDLCRMRYNEIKRLETENVSLKGHERITKNSNQMDSPIRTRAYNNKLKNY